MKTIVTFDAYERNLGIYCKTNNAANFYITAFSNDTLTIDFAPGIRIHSAAEMIAGCFEKGSNLYGIKCIKFIFNKKTITVNTRNATVNEIINMYYYGH